MKKIIVLSVMSFLLYFLTLFASEINPPKRGYFQNSKGEKCWYKTTLKESKYFGPASSLVCTHTFESSKMLNDKTSKLMIANVVVRFYIGTKFQRDTKFKTNPDDWAKAKGFQKKGFCISSSNYPLPAVWIDFKLSSDKKYILQVIHSEGL
jgi:hypothetical protein